MIPFFLDCLWMTEYLTISRICLFRQEFLTLGNKSVLVWLTFGGIVNDTTFPSQLHTYIFVVGRYASPQNNTMSSVNNLLFGK